MPFYATAYDTTAGRGISVNKVTGAIAKALVRENFAIVNNQQPGIEMPIPQDGCVPTVLTTQTEGEMSVPVFAHPVFVDLSEIRKSSVETYLVSDARPYMIGKPVDRDGKLVVKNKTEFDFTKNRTILSSHWYKRNTESFKHLSPALIGIYSSWLSESISRVFGLDAGDQQLLAVVAAYHYQSLFYPYSKFDESDRLKIASAVSRATLADIDSVIDLIDENPVMEGLYDLCEVAKKVTANPRLQELNPGVVISMIHTSWMGTNGREIAAVALEHVPTFVMMVYSSFTERSYKFAPLSKIVERYRGRKGEDMFIRSLKSLLDELKTA